MKNESEIREKIIETTVGLIREHGDINKIKIRDIASSAGIGVGLVNYHFQTKENLVNICVQRIISNVISGFRSMHEALDLPPRDKLKVLAKSTAAFLASNPGLSRISILSDMTNPFPGDNTCQTIEAYTNVFREVFGERKTDEEITMLLHVMTSTIQAAFLRKGVADRMMGVDFDDKEKRDAFVDSLIDLLTKDI